MAISTISTILTMQVTPGAGSYAAGITITNTGGVSLTSASAIYGGPSVVGVNILNQGNVTGEVDFKTDATLINQGSIGNQFESIYLQDGGLITNNGNIGAPGVSGEGVDIAHGTLNNYGTIARAGVGVNDRGNSTITNTNLISGQQFGVLLGIGSTLLNSGTISASHAVAVGNNYEVVENSGIISGSSYAIDVIGSNFVLTVDPGAVFDGRVEDQVGSGQLILAGTTAGSLDIGDSFSGFPNIDFAAGATWALEGSTNDLGNQRKISGFTNGDTIRLDGFAATSYTYVSGTGILLSNGTVIETLDITGSFSTTDFHVTSSAGVTDIQIACFAAGTRILTPHGHVAVEDLAVGDAVITGDDDDRPITWIGKRQLDLTRHAAPANAQPVRIAAGSFAEAVPSRDLLLSPDHAIHIDGMLVPAKALINGKNICQLSRAGVTYYHIELATHGIIFAENLGVETYLESGNRGAFENGGASLTLHPDLAQSLREASGCAPFAETGPVVEAARMRILQRYYATAAVRRA